VHNEFVQMLIQTKPCLKVVALWSQV